MVSNNEKQLYRLIGHEDDINMFVYDFCFLKKIDFINLTSFYINNIVLISKSFIKYNSYYLYNRDKRILKEITKDTFTILLNEYVPDKRRIIKGYVVMRIRTIECTFKIFSKLSNNHYTKWYLLADNECYNKIYHRLESHKIITKRITKWKRNNCLF